MSIKAGHEFEAAGCGTLFVDEIDSSDGSVMLRIDAENPWFWIEDIRELAKFLKKLQRQLEQADLDTLD